MSDGTDFVRTTPHVRVSVAMATYNGAGYVAEQLASIAAQTLVPDELVVSDDGSTDNTLAIVRTFAETAPFPVRILDKPQRLGFADNFLFAIEACRCDIVALSDQDDVWLPQKLSTGVSRLVEDDSLLSLHRLTLTDQALHPIGPWEQGIAGDAVFEPLQLDPWSGWGNTMVLRRELATLFPRDQRPRQPLEDRPLSHDSWLYILAAAAGSVAHIAEPLILYRQHGRNAMGMNKPGIAKRIATAVAVPLTAYRERYRFFDELAAVFDRLAARTQGDVELRARAAAHEYRKRRDRASTRVRLHTDTAIGERLRAFVQLHWRSNEDADTGSDLRLRLRLLSAIKDFGFGVTGLGRHV